MARSGRTEIVFLCKVASFVKCPLHQNTKSFVALVKLSPDFHLAAVFLTGANFIYLVFF